MRYLKLYENFNDLDIHEICKKYDIENYTINEDGSIDVDESIDLSNNGLTKIPLKFRNVSGNFYCSYNLLTSLENCPESVGFTFNCTGNKLTSLDFCPEFIGINFRCSNNLLTTLKGCPKSILGSFYCSNNKLTSLDFCPKSIDGNFYCINNKLTSLEFMPRCQIAHFDRNNIRDFKYFKEIFNFYCEDNPIYEIWKLFTDTSYVELLNEYDCIRGEDIIIDRLNQFLEEIDKPTVKSVKGYFIFYTINII